MQINQIKLKDDPVLIERAGDNVYYNITFVNNNDNGNFLPIPVQFRETRTTTLLPGVTSDYKMSVVRFDMPTDLIPIQFFPTQDHSINVSTYSVTLSWNGFVHQIFLLWDTEDETAPTPIPPFPIGDKPFYHDYYAMFNIEHFMRLINKALLSAHNLLVANGAPGLVLNFPPFLYYNTTTNLISLYAPVAYNSDNVTPINIYFNASLISNFGSSLPSEVISHFSIDGRDVQIFVHDDIINRQSITYPGPVIIDYFVMTQEYNALSLMLDFASIVVTSTSLPMRNEWINIQGNNDNNFLSVLSDFLVPPVTGNEIRNRVIYYPTAQFRYSTLISELPINVIDIQFYWKSKQGRLFPIFLSPFREGSIKILFEKK
jgi:hypothetical protein